MKTFKTRLEILAIVFLVFAGITSCSTDDKGIASEDKGPKVSSLSSNTVHFNDLLIINGENFGPTAADNTVTINDVVATVYNASATKLEVYVPAVGNTTGEIKITTRGKSISGGTVTYVPDVFVGGMLYVGVDENYISKYWVNGTETQVSDNNSVIRSIFVEHNNIYLCGENDGVAQYWENGTPTSMGTGQAYNIFVANSEVYVACGGYFPLYWKNGTRTELANSFGAAASIFTKGNDIYVAGNLSGRAYYWKNGTPVRLSNLPSYGNSIAVAGSDIYVTGHEQETPSGIYKAIVWKNGNALTISNDYSVPYSIAVNGNDVYVSGYTQQASGEKTLTYWKNGNAFPLASLGTAEVINIGIKVFGNDVYVAAFEYAGGKKTAKYWKNGTAVTLSNIPNNTEATCIYIR
ncbi:IPT/TIG domain-containing protein [Flavobacterium lindanitolerans]|uniref:IPT/TIG domain-containing protein n=1 Tax=Flavobacterium lindanitolerans TaxID=428988 RepID=UPI0031D83CF2